MSKASRAPATASLLGRLKRQAKADAKATGQPHTQLLEAAAIAAGYSSFHELHQACARGTPEPGMPVDPRLPPMFDETANETRSKEELDQWWDRPFAVTLEDGRFDVRCLDGGAWDRSTWYGVADDLEAAIRLGAEKLAAWRVFRETPHAYLDNGKVFMVLGPQRPDQDHKVLYEAKDEGDAAAWLDRYKAQAAAGRESSSVSSKSESGNAAGESTIVSP